MKIPLQLFLSLLPIISAAAPVLKLDDLIYRPIEFTVRDEQGNPVENAQIIASDPGPMDRKGHTDGEGRLTLNLAVQVSLTIDVDRKGYYSTRGRIWQSGMEKLSSGSYRPREMPDSHVVVLKKIRDPRDLIYRMYRGRAPKSGNPVGFDLVEGDWVAPHGIGRSPDLLFHFHDMDIHPDTFKGSMTITFPNVGDGIQAFKATRPLSMEYGSALAPPHQAPLDGYTSRLTYSLSHKQGEPYSDYKVPDRNYILRTRTLMDAEGRIRQACYGWIPGEIEFDPRDPKGPQLTFTYHFNPDPNPNQRSLESTMYLPD